MRSAIPLLAAALAVLLGCSQSTPREAGPPVAAAPAPAAGLDPMFPELVAFRPEGLPSACVEEAVVAADQFIKLHTELMVVGLTCQAQYGDDGLFDDYALFTNAHQSLIRQVQSTMGSFLGRHLRVSNARLYDTYRTAVANEEASVVIDVGNGPYCHARRQQFTTAAAFTPAQLQSYLDLAVARYWDAYNVCGSARPTVVAAPFTPPRPPTRPALPVVAAVPPAGG